MINIRLSLFKIRLQCIRIICKRRDLYTFLFAISFDLICFFLCQVCYINVADTCISSLRSSLRPACNFQTFQSVFCRKVYNFFKRHSITNSCNKSKFHFTIISFPACFSLYQQVFLCLNCIVFFISILPEFILFNYHFLTLFTLLYITKKVRGQN